MTTETPPTETPPSESPAVQNATKSLDEFRRSLAQLTPRAWVTPALIAANFAVFIAFCISDPKNIMEPTNLALIKWGANYGPATTSSGQWWRLLTCTFMHIGLIHIAMNMAVLFDVGRIVEKMTGNLGFLVAYLLAGLGGSLASVLWNPQVLSAGASGAVFGIYGVLLGFLLRSRGSVPPDVLKHLQKSAVVFIGYNVFYGLAKSGIDNAAHLGGLVTGFGCGLVLAHPLTVEGVRTRAKKALAVLGGGLVLLAGVSFAVPRGVDFFGELDRFAAMESPVIDAYNGIIIDKKITDEEAVVRLDRDVLPPWRAEVDRWKKMKGLPSEQQALADKVGRYLTAREEGFAWMRDGAQKHDAELYKKGYQRVHESGEIMKDTNK